MHIDQRVRFKTLLYLTVLFFCRPFFCNAAFISGVVTDEYTQPIAYANVYLQPSLKGTTTNAEGFYKLEVLPGTYTIVFKYLGYKTQTQQITISDKDVAINLSLLPESFMLNGVTINAGGEDPAYAIIRNAINKRKFYLNQVNGYNCNVYIKGVQKLTKYPDKFMGNVVDFGGQVDSVTGIFYLSESVSKFSFKKPGKIKEEMISSRISGSSKSFSYNQASDMLFNFYENNVMGKAIGERGYISPIAESALFYYRYKLEGSSVENDVLIHKISVTPRRKFDPAFRGVIYIAEGSWRIQSMDVYLTRDAGLEFLDTLRIRQTYLPVNNNDIWMPVNNRFDFSFKILGFTGGGNYVGYFSNFEIDPVFAKRTFSNEILKVEADANKKDSTYWETIRPIPLTLEEKIDYIKKDSLAIVRTTEQYNDSMDNIRNKFSVTSYLLNGYSYRKGFKKIASNKLENFPRLKTLLDAKGKHAFLLILYLRLIPFVPSGFITFAAAIGRVSALTFIGASSIGKIPALLLEGYAAYQVIAFGWQGKIILTIVAILLFYFTVKQIITQKKN